MALGPRPRTGRARRSVTRTARPAPRRTSARCSDAAWAAFVSAEVHSSNTRIRPRSRGSTQKSYATHPSSAWVVATNGSTRAIAASKSSGSMRISPEIDERHGCDRTGGTGIHRSGPVRPYAFARGWRRHRTGPTLRERGGTHADVEDRPDRRRLRRRARWVRSCRSSAAGAARYPNPHAARGRSRADQTTARRVEAQPAPRGRRPCPSPAPTSPSSWPSVARASGVGVVLVRRSRRLRTS